MNPPTRKDKLLEKWITAIGTKFKGICTFNDISQRGKRLKVICAKESGVRMKLFLKFVKNQKIFLFPASIQVSS